MINTLRMMFRTVSILEKICNGFGFETVTYFLCFVGEALIKRIYTALRNSPQWNSTLFIVTFDEHGGFYDHVTPPMNVPNPDGLNADDPVYFGFDRLGVRVPTLMISPWINKVRLLDLANVLKFVPYIIAWLSYELQVCVLTIFLFELGNSCSRTGIRLLRSHICLRYCSQDVQFA
jgi:hypothetical protein